jgi:hypothetical protein
MIRIDSYTILEEFMGGLPQTMISRCFREHRLTTKANLLNDWVGTAKDIEHCDKTESYYKDRSRHRNLTTPLSMAPRQIAKAMPKAQPVAKEKEEDASPQKPGVALAEGEGEACLKQRIRERKGASTVMK